MKTVVCLAVLLLMVSCGSLAITNSTSSKNINYGELKRSSIEFYGVGNVDTLAFRKTFVRNFKTKAELDKAIYADLTTAFRKINPAIKMKMGELKLPKYFRGHESLINNEKGDAIDFLKNTKSDYIMIIKNILVNDQFSSSTVVAANGMATSSSSEQCISKYDFELWNVKTQTKELSFTSGGEASVALWMYTKALRNSMEDAVEVAAEYIKLEGKLE